MDARFITIPGEWGFQWSPSRCNGYLFLGKFLLVMASVNVFMFGPQVFRRLIDKSKIISRIVINSGVRPL